MTLMWDLLDRNIWGEGVSYKLVDREGEEVGEHRGERKEWMVAGGRSDGLAITVASGAAVVSVKSSTGDIVWIPAAWVGVVSFKPGYGRVIRPWSWTLCRAGPS